MSANPIILASSSPIRAALLHRAGIPFEVKTSAVDEARLKQENPSLEPEELVKILALAKAKAVSVPNTAAVIGADQVLVFEGRIYDKPATREDMRHRLKALRGQTHSLIGAVCVTGEEDDWVYISHVRMTMRNFSNDFLETYIKAQGDDILYTVGGYMYEGAGVQLFEKTQGDYFSILGLSLLPLLAELRRRGAILS